MQRRMAATQDHRVAGLEAQSGNINRDVRTRLVDHAHDAHRHAHLREPDAIGKVVAAHDAPHRVRQRRDIAHTLSRGFHTCLIEAKPVEQALRHAGFLRRGIIRVVGLSDGSGIGHQGIGDGQQQRVLPIRRGTRKVMLGVLRLGSHAPHGHQGISHGIAIIHIEPPGFKISHVGALAPRIRATSHDVGKNTGTQGGTRHAPATCIYHIMPPPPNLMRIRQRRTGVAEVLPPTGIYDGYIHGRI